MQHQFWKNLIVYSWANQILDRSFPRSYMLISILYSCYVKLFFYTTCLSVHLHYAPTLLLHDLLPDDLIVFIVAPPT